jgi:hypothetical protein
MFTAFRCFTGECGLLVSSWVAGFSHFFDFQLRIWDDNPNLVGGLAHGFHFSIYWECHNPN